MPRSHVQYSSMSDAQVIGVAGNLPRLGPARPCSLQGVHRVGGLQQ